MTEADIRAAFGAFDSKHPFYLAVEQMLADAIVQEQDSVVVPNLPDSGRHFNAGRLAQAKDFSAAFGAVMRQAVLDRMREEQRAGQ